MKRTSVLGVSSFFGLVGLHRTVQLSFFSVTGWDIGLYYHDIEWFALETEIIPLFLTSYLSTSFQTLFLTMMATPFLLRDSCPQ